MRLSTAIALLCAAAASAATVKPTHRVSVPDWRLWTEGDQTSSVRFTIENDDPKKPKYNCQGEEADLKNNTLVQCFRDQNTESSTPTTYWFGLTHEKFPSSGDYKLTLAQAVGTKTSSNPIKMRLFTVLALLGGAAAIISPDHKPEPRVERYHIGPLTIYDNVKDAIDFATFTLPGVDVMCFGNSSQLAEGTGACNVDNYRFGLTGSMVRGWKEYNLTVWKKGEFDTKQNK
ncbi:hypothetical protein SLS55_005867 [Diplodia seriata]|uniref:AA1-like domain-containing protein n=1 Tax=Diplodia seriata TaxID=420778 RepID=A0ABR3CKB2_9PEZI